MEILVLASAITVLWYVGIAGFVIGAIWTAIRRSIKHRSDTSPEDSVWQSVVFPSLKAGVIIGVILGLIAAVLVVYWMGSLMWGMMP